MKIFVMFAILSIPIFCAAEEQGVAGLTAHDIVDNRTTLDLSQRMKHRLLSNMREQLAATRTIIGLLAQDKFERASSTARAKLGTSEDLKQVYDSSKNEELKKLGRAANSSANELAKTLQSKDLKKSLLALKNSMGHCLECHSKFRR